MIAIIATFSVARADADAFAAVAAELVAATNANEPGVRLYTLVRNATDPTEYRMMELYEDQAAIDAHTASAWYVGLVQGSRAQTGALARRSAKDRTLYRDRLRGAGHDNRSAV